MCDCGGMFSDESEGGNDGYFNQRSGEQRSRCGNECGAGAGGCKTRRGGTTEGITCSTTGVTWAGLDAAKQENTTWIYVENSSYSGFFAAKGYVAYAQMEMDGTSIFLVSDGSYQDGDHTYAISCDVYRVGADAAPEKLGSLESGGTAYPLSSGADGIYVTSGHSIEVYTIDAANGKLGLARSNTEVYDENGNATYYRLDDQGQTVESTEEEYIKEWDIYSKVASPIEFTVQK